MTAAEDLDLVRRCLAGNRDQFQGLVEKYQQRIYSMIYVIVLNRELARDLTQDTFIKAWRALKSFQGRSSFYTWLYKIGFNLALDSKRGKARKPVQVELEERRLPDPREGLVRPDRAVLRMELNAVIRRGLESLSLSQRTVLLLREWEGRSYQEIADLTGSSVGTVMSRLHYGREKLKEYLKPYLKNRD